MLKEIFSGAGTVVNFRYVLLPMCLYCALSAMRIAVLVVHVFMC